MRAIDTIVVHCTATPKGHDVTAADVDRWHKERGFNGIGYHYLVRLDGRIERGRPESEPGAHVAGHNSNSIGVCYAGGCDAGMNPMDTRTEAQKASLKKLLVELKSRYPQAAILGHRDFPGVAKACPSFDAKNEYKDL